MVFTSSPPIAFGLRPPDLALSTGGGGLAGVVPPLAYPQAMRIWAARMLVCRSMLYRFMSEQFTGGSPSMLALRGRLFAPTAKLALDAALVSGPELGEAQEPGADWPSMGDPSPTVSSANSPAISLKLQVTLFIANPP